MKRVTFVLSAVVVTCLMPGLVQAGTYTFTPNPSDLSDLDHTKAYSWGINLVLPAGQQAISATLTFDNIRNWDNSPNVLYVRLLNYAPLGVRQHTDNEGGGDYFAGFAGGETHLVTYVNLPSTSQDLSYSFTGSELAALNTYLADGRFGLGFDPDCHFYNCGVGLSIVTPEPAAAMLLAIGGLIGLRRRRSN